MKRVLMAMLIAGIMFCSGCKKADNTVAVKVGDMAITNQEIVEQIDKQMSSPFFSKLDKKSDDAKVLILYTKQKVVEELIIKKILGAEILKRNLTVSQEELDKRKAEIIKEIGGEENLKKVLKINNLDENGFNEMLSEEMQMNKLIESIAPIKVSEAEAKKFYNENKASKFTHPDMVRASHILIKKENKAKAEQILAKAKEPNADFAALAKENSEDTGSAKDGGDLGFFSKEQMVKPFADAAFSMKPDTVSDLVESEFGYHIIKVTDRKKAGVTPFNDVKFEIIKYLLDTQRMEALQKFVENQKAQVKVEYISEEYNPEKIKNEIQDIAKKKQAEMKAKGEEPAEAPNTEVPAGEKK